MRPSQKKSKNQNSQPTSRHRQVVGLHSVMEVFKVRPHAVEKVFLKANWKESKELLQIAELAQRQGVRVENIQEGVLEKLSRVHQGVLVEVSETPTLDLHKLKDQKKSMVLALDGIEDPHNMGAIIRTAWLMGVSGILVPESRIAPLSPTVAKVASGGLEHVPVQKVGSLGPTLLQMKEMGFWILGLDAEAKSNIWQLKAPDKVVWVLGAEGHGIRKQTKGACDELLRLYQVSPNHSLNVSVAAGIATAEIIRQWKT
ncbi:MAG: 23S rRNA (guanosine(2251)-2'-O)-methyltransferase RlmB [Bdellovibrionales bacterium]